MASACGGDQLRRAAMIEKAAAVYVCVYVVLKSVIVVGRHGRALALLHDSGASLAATNARLGTTANESPAFSGCKPSWRQKRGHGGWSGPARPQSFLPSARPWFVWFHPRHGHRACRPGDCRTGMPRQEARESTPARPLSVSCRQGREGRRKMMAPAAVPTRPRAHGWPWGGRSVTVGERQHSARPTS
jgi:hypothetical protein